MSTNDHAAPSAGRRPDIDAAEPTDAQVIIDARTDPAMFGILFDRHFVTIHRYIA